MKLGELWSTAQGLCFQKTLKIYFFWFSERVYGENYWIPANVYDVVIFPNDFLKNHLTIYPPHADENSGATPTLRVVYCEQKPDAAPESKVIYHVVFSHAGHRETLSIFRTQDVNEAIDFCRRCEECRVLFKMLGKL